MSNEIGARLHGRLAFVLVVASLLLLVGCGATGSTSTGNAPTASQTSTSKLCQHVSTINQSLTRLASIGDNTTVSEVKAAQQNLTNALDAVDALPGSGGSALSTLKSTNDQLAAALKDLPDSATVGQVGPRLSTFKGKVSQAQAAAAQLASTLHCSS